MKTVMTWFFPFLLIGDLVARCGEPADRYFYVADEYMETGQFGEGTNWTEFDPNSNEGFPGGGESDSNTCQRKKYSFANHVNGYSGCTDIELQQAFPDEALYDGLELSTDLVRDEELPYTSESQALIRMNDIFGYGAYQIPPNARITNAYLTVYSTNDTDCEIAVHRMLEGWHAGTTWNMLGGVSTNGLEAAAVADDVLPDADSDQYYSFDVSASLTAWQNSPDENLGWAILNRCDDGWRIFSSETSLAHRRPKLTIEVCGALPDAVPNLPPKVLLSDNPESQNADGAISDILEVVVADADSDPMNVTFFGRVKSDDYWTVIVIPDTQYYTTDSEWEKGIFPLQTQWIADNVDALNIQMVLSAGDLVETASVASHWARADAALSTLIDADIPYMPTPGDHDHVDQWEDGSLESFTETFPESRFSDNTWWGESFDETNSSHYVLLTIGLDDYIFLGLDFCPDDEEIEWANAVLNDYNDRKAIFITHGLMDDTGDFYATDDCGREDGDSYFIWEKLVSRHNHLNLALSAHMHRRDGEYRRTDDNVNGVPVHMVTADYQSREPDRGNGLLRIMTFFPSDNEIHVQTYSPYTDTFESDEDSEFVLPYEMTDDNPFEPIGTVANVSSGDHATYHWTGLKSGATYEWYAVASDGIRKSRSAVTSFTK